MELVCLEKQLLVLMDTNSQNETLVLLYIDFLCPSLDTGSQNYSLVLVYIVILAPSEKGTQ